MHLGMTGSRGVQQAAKIADIAGAELKWTKEEKEHFLAEFKKDLLKESRCLAR